jgi:hypothetical protein
VNSGKYHGLKLEHPEKNFRIWNEKVTFIKAILIKMLTPRGSDRNDGHDVERCVEMKIAFKAGCGYQ